MSWRDPKFRYVRSDEMKPDYLARKFAPDIAKVRKQRRDNEKEAEQKVEQLPAKKRA